MPHADFSAVRVRALAEPITFSLAGVRFTAMDRPSLGDVFELMDAPDPDFAKILEGDEATLGRSCRALADFVRRLLVPDDKARWDRLLYELPNDQAGPLIEVAQWLVENMTGFPTTPPASSSGGRQRGGPSSKRSAAGTRT